MYGTNTKKDSPHWYMSWLPETINPPNIDEDMQEQNKRVRLIRTDHNSYKSESTGNGIVTFAVCQHTCSYPQYFLASS